MTWWQVYFDDQYLVLAEQLGAYGEDEGQQQAKAVVQMMQIEPPAKLLDLCCGTGRHAIPLAQMGFAVSGLDYSDASLARARKKVAQAGVSVAFLRGDMRQLPWEKQFDGCVMLGGSFGIFGDEAENERVLHAVAGVLKPSGRFFLDVANRDRIVCEHRSRDWQGTDNWLRCIERWFDPVAGVNYARERWGREGEWIERTHQMRLYTATELDRMLRQAGLTPVAYYGGYDQSEFTIRSHRILIIAEKGE
jgi:ubiquinone/menaquinone biosynthesis C-methylase UbiE